MRFMSEFIVRQKRIISDEPQNQRLFKGSKRGYRGPIRSGCIVMCISNLDLWARS